MWSRNVNKKFSSRFSIIENNRFERNNEVPAAVEKKRKQSSSVNFNIIDCSLVERSALISKTWCGNRQAAKLIMMLHSAIKIEFRGKSSHYSSSPEEVNDIGG